MDIKIKNFEETLNLLKSIHILCDCDICVKIKKQPTEKTVIDMKKILELLNKNNEPKEIKEPEFKVGDVVVLRSGGCDMTIEAILEENPEIIKNTLVECVYMNYMSKVERVLLSKNAIKKVKHVI